MDLSVGAPIQTVVLKEEHALLMSLSKSKMESKSLNKFKSNAEFTIFVRIGTTMVGLKNGLLVHRCSVLHTLTDLVFITFNLT